MKDHASSIQLDSKLKKRVWIQTFGCQMNENDTQKMYRVLDPLNYQPTTTPEDADLILLNTCSIREKPEQKVFSSLGRLKKFKELRPEVKIGVTGCMAQLLGKDIITRAPYVDMVMGTYSIHKLPEILNNLEKSVMAPGQNAIVEAGKLEKDDFEFLPLKAGDFLRAHTNPLGQERAVSQHVTIQNGCNKNCSYCVVPTTRGREISREKTEIHGEIRLLVEKGVKEVVLVGQTVNSYGKGSHYDFSDLLYDIEKIDGLERLRFVTSHPRDINEKLAKAMRDCAKVCEQLHLPMQSGSDRILREMYRGYTFSKYQERIELLRSYLPGLALGGDIIVGFPDETEDDFQATLNAVATIRYDSLFSFIFSPRPYTKAKSMSGQISLDVAKERLSRLQALQNKITAEKLSTYEGQVVEVLCEGGSQDSLSGVRIKRSKSLRGRTRKNQLVHFDGPASLKGHLVPVKIDRCLSHSLQGQWQQSH